MHKTNVLTHAGGLWSRTFAAVAAEYPDVTTEYQHVDAAAMYLVTQPQRYDVIVTDNLFGDILTDIAAAVTGGIGLAASGCINPERDLPVHVRAGTRLGARTSPVAASPTRSRRCCRRRCCWTTSVILSRRRVCEAVAAELAARTAGRAAAYRGGRRPDRRPGRLSVDWPARHASDRHVRR